MGVLRELKLSTEEIKEFVGRCVAPMSIGCKWTDRVGAGYGLGEYAWIFCWSCRRSPWA